MKQQNTSNQINIYKPGNTTRIEVNLDGDTVWLSKPKLTSLFNTTRPHITMHIKNIFDQNELKKMQYIRISYILHLMAKIKILLIHQISTNSNSDNFLNHDYTD